MFAVIGCVVGIAGVAAAVVIHLRSRRRAVVLDVYARAYDVIRVNNNDVGHAGTVVYVEVRNQSRDDVTLHPMWCSAVPAGGIEYWIQDVRPVENPRLLSGEAVSSEVFFPRISLKDDPRPVELAVSTHCGKLIKRMIRLHPSKNEVFIHVEGEPPAWMTKFIDAGVMPRLIIELMPNAESIPPNSHSTQ